MKRLVALVLVVAVAALGTACGGGAEETTPTPPGGAAADTRPAAGQVRITSYGHSMFAIESPGGITVLTDPNKDIGYAPPGEGIDVVTVSHDHFDHNKVEVAPDARVLRGLTEDGGWADIDETIGDVRVRAVATFHDDREGAERGKNAMFVFDIGEWRIVHAGDLAHPGISFENIPDLEASFGPDVLLIPVGGHFTIGPQEADAVIASLRPRLVIPMHYRTRALRSFPEGGRLARVDDFLEGKANVRRQGSSSLTVGPEPATDSLIIVLDFQPQ